MEPEPSRRGPSRTPRGPPPQSPLAHTPYSFWRGHGSRRQARRSPHPDPTGPHDRSELHAGARSVEQAPQAPGSRGRGVRRLEKALDVAPPDHSAWYGYAEFCLYLGREEDYLAARRALLAKFGETKYVYVAERTSRACLLRPASGEELRRAVALAGRVGAIDRANARATLSLFPVRPGSCGVPSGSPRPGDLLDERGRIQRARPGPSARARDGPATERPDGGGKKDARRGRAGPRLEERSKCAIRTGGSATSSAARPSG